VSAPDEGPSNEATGPATETQIIAALAAAELFEKQALPRRPLGPAGEL
jgi:hypothetical protein